MAVRRVGIDVSGRQTEKVSAKLSRPEGRGWLRRCAAGKFDLAMGRPPSRSRKHRG
jgi:hypothetical protein